MRTIRLAKGDTEPKAILTLYDNSGARLDVSAPGDVVRMHVREVGLLTVLETITLEKLAGLLADDGTVDSTGVYATAGKGGRVAVPWTSTATDTAGIFEGQIEVTRAGGGKLTILDLLRFEVYDK